MAQPINYLHASVLIALHYFKRHHVRYTSVHANIWVTILVNVISLIIHFPSLYKQILMLKDKGFWLYLFYPSIFSSSSRFLLYLVPNYSELDSLQALLKLVCDYHQPKVIL